MSNIVPVSNSLYIIIANCPWLPLFYEDNVRPQSPPENYRDKLIVVDYCKQSLRHTLALIVASITTYQMATRLEWNVFHFDA